MNLIKKFNLAVAVILVFPLVTAANEWARPDKIAEAVAGVHEEACVSWWGFDEEDSTYYLQSAIDSGVTRVSIPAMGGRDWIVRPIRLTHDDQTIFFEPGVVVQAKPGSIRNRGTRLFEAVGRRNITLSGYGATLRMGRNPEFIREYYQSRRRGGDLICILGSENVIIEGFHLVEAWNDGIYIGRGGGKDYCSNVTVRDVVAEGNHRQGMSIVSVNGMLVENSVFKNTRGGAPMAGIDCETHNPHERMSNVVIRNNLFLDNSQLGIHNWPSDQTEESAPISILWENNYVRGSVVGIHVASVNTTTPKGEIVFRNNIVEGSAFAGILIRRAGLSGLNIRFEGNMLINTAHETYDDDDENRFYREIWEGVMDNPGDWFARHGCPSAPIVLTSQGNSPRVQGNISFNNDIVISRLDKPAVVVSGPWGADHEEMFGPDAEPSEDDFQAWENVSGIIRVVNPYGARMEVLTPVRNFEVKLMPAGNSGK